MGRRLFRLFLLVLIPAGCAFILFLFRPLYFIKLDKIIENNISEIFHGKLDFDNFQGNMIDGFSITNIKFSYDDSVICSVEDLYIKPALSFIIFGDLVFSSVEIKNAEIEWFLSTNEIFNVNTNDYLRNYNIFSFKIVDSSINYMNQLYNIDGQFSIRNAQQLHISFQDFSIEPPVPDSEITIASGSVQYYLDQYNLDKIILESKWVNGIIDCSINLNNYSSSISNIDIQMMHIHLDEEKVLRINNFTFDLEESINLMIDKISYSEIEFYDIIINGVIINDIILGNYSFLYLDTFYNNEVEVSFDSLSWKAVLQFNQFVIDNNTNLSGVLNIEGLYNLDLINITMDLHDSIIDSKEFNSISGQFIVTPDKDIDGEIEINSKMKMEYCIFSSYLCFNLNFINNNSYF